jgi:hypothetical protein
MSERARRDELRSARLLLGEHAPAEAIGSRRVRAAVRSRPIPPRPVRFLQLVQRKLGRLDYRRSVSDPLARARRAALGADAPADPRFLVRVDEFPHYLAWDDPERFGSEQYLRFHAVLGAAAPYLVAVLPRLSHAPLDPEETSWRALQDDERQVLRRLAADGSVTLGLHGLDHRTRDVSPRRHSELCGLGASATERLLDDGLAELAPLGIAPEVFVPPYNRFDAEQYALLARRFAVVCGGPESIAHVGFQRTPLWRGDAVYLPSYFPLYGRARDVLPEAERLIEQRIGLWAPIVLHWGWEAEDDYASLKRLLAVIGRHTARWEEFLAAAKASKSAYA